MERVSRKNSDEYPRCFYCGGLIANNCGVGDHFPVPRACGGVHTVPCCTSCHDMKDRFSIGSWPTEWLSKIMIDWPSLNRETRIFLAKTMSALESCREFGYTSVERKAIILIRELRDNGYTTDEIVSSLKVMAEKKR